MDCKDHIPDMSTLRVTSDGGAYYLDVDCRTCGTGGSVGEIIWDGDEKTLQVGIENPIPLAHIFD